MIELLRLDAATLRLGYAGDSLNTAVYLKRTATALDLDLEVGFLTGLGSDAESDAMRRFWSSQYVHDWSITVADRQPGLYLIRNDTRGERTFAYWRDGSAAATLFKDVDWVDALHADLLFLSGITVQLMSPVALDALVARLGVLRRAGTVVVLDSNYRPEGWQSAAAARKAMDAVLATTDIALVTLADEIDLGRAVDLESCINQIRELGVSEITVKDGDRGSWVVSQGEVVHVAVEAAMVVDTTAAGDSFNGAYLAARIAGQDPARAAATGNRLARVVVGNTGAIIPQESMPELLVRQSAGSERATGTELAGGPSVQDLRR